MTVSAADEGVVASSSPLTGLPPELRNTIYRLVLSDQNVALDVRDPALGTKAALLRTCTLIRDEASSIFYGENTFRIMLNAEGGKTKAAARWIEKIGERGRLFRTIDVEFDMSPLSYMRFVQRCEVMRKKMSLRRATQTRLAEEIGEEDGGVLVTALSKAVDAGLDIGTIHIRNIDTRPFLRVINSVYESSVCEVLEKWCDQKKLPRASRTLRNDMGA